MKAAYFALRQRGLMLWAALPALLLAMLNPEIRLPHDIHNFVFVVDITQSMNVRDMSLNGTAASRLEYARHLLGKSIAGLPCGTKISVALFANAEVVPLFTPIEVCANYGVLQDTLAHLDWRQAWHGSSRLRFGLQAASSSLITLKEPAQIVFLTDGDEAPPLNSINKIELTGLQGSNGWLLVGVGSDRPAPIPKFNARNQIMGYWSVHGLNYQPSQIVDEESLGKRDDSIATSPEEYYLSALNDGYLKELAVDIGASYVRGDRPENLLAAMKNLPAAGHDDSPVSIGWLFALLAGIFVMFEHLPMRVTRH